MNLNKYPLVSILIPFYNHNHFIKKTLDSILEDTYPNKEIIIINDGSTDPDDSNIIKWIEEHGEEITIKYIKRENKGVSKTMNELIMLANGEYVIPCASDDYFINNTIENRINILEKNKDKLILLSDCIVVDNDNNLLYDSNLFSYRITTKEKYFSDDGLKDIIINEWSFAGATWIAKRELFNKIGYLNELLIVEDWDFFLRIVANEYASFYDEKVSAYRIHDTNTSRNETKVLQMYTDLYNTAINNLELFNGTYKKDLLKKSKYYKNKCCPFIINKLINDIKIKIKPIRYKIKGLFKNEK
jgi:glycosyltransferase involved in cell wall biosynthesis